MLNLPVIINPLRTYLYGQRSFWMEVLFTTPFNWIFGKIKFFENCRHEFHFCWREIHYTTFALAFFCWHEIIWVRKTVSPWSLTFFYCLNNNFLTKKFIVLRWSFDWKLISANVSRDVQKPLTVWFVHVTDCYSTVWAVAIWISFCSHKISLCSKLPYFDGVTLNHFGYVYLTETHA